MAIDPQTGNNMLENVWWRLEASACGMADGVLRRASVEMACVPAAAVCTVWTAAVAVTAMAAVVIPTWVVADAAPATWVAKVLFWRFCLVC